MICNRRRRNEKSIDALAAGVMFRDWRLAASSGDPRGADKRFAGWP